MASRRRRLTANGPLVDTHSMGRSSFLRYLPRVGAAVVLFTFAVYTAHVGLRLGGASTNGFFNDFVYNGLELSAAAACLLRAGLVREGRLPWLVMGIGLLCWAGGDIYWTLFLADKDSPPVPSPADALYLVFYP